MINLKTIEVLKKQGYEMDVIKQAIKAAEQEGQANLDGWVIRYNDKNEMIVLHQNWNGIYIGDFKTSIHFEKVISYNFTGDFFVHAKYSELEKVLEKVNENKTNGFIFCQCSKCDFERRKKQLAKFGYKVHKTNIEQIESDYGDVSFLIAKGGQ